MKILHCIGKLKGGGAETQLNILINHEKKHKHVVLSHENAENGCNTFYKLEKRLNILQKWIRVYKILKTEKPDVIHIWLPAVFHIYFLPALFFPAKCVLGVRNVYQLENFKRYLHLFIYFLSKKIVSNTHIDDQKGWFRSVYIKKEYFFIPNAIKFDIEKPKRDNLINNKTKQLLYVGRLVNQKNLINLINALSGIKDHNWELKIIGEGYLRQTLMEKVDNLQLHNKISFIEFTNQIENYYKNADALILPSFTEGMPNVVFEAASFQNMLILSNIPQHKRWFNDHKNALLFDPYSKEELQTCIVKFLQMDADEIYTFNLNTFEVIKTLSKETYTKKYVEMYHQINHQ